jgi:hypothetical protein
MDPITCGGCMFWVQLEKCMRDGTQLGECRRYPSPQVAERPKTHWCGEAIGRGISPQGGRNK